MTQLKEILTAARAIISDVEHWAQGVRATDITGQECSPDDEEAYAFCADAALGKAAGGFTLPSGEPNPMYTAAFNAVERVAKRLFRRTMIELNDEGYWGMINNREDEDYWQTFCHAAVLEAFDAAIYDLTHQGRYFG